MLHNYTKHKNSKMFAVAYSSVGEAIDHIEVTEVNEKKAIEEFEQRMGIFPFGYYVIFTKTAPYYYNLGGGIGMAKDGLRIGDLRKELNRINSSIEELEIELKSPDVSDYRINQIEVVLLPDLEYGRSLYLFTLKNKLNTRYLETGKAIKEDLPLMNSKKEEYIIHGKGFKNGGGVGNYKMVAFPEDKTYKYYVVDEDENNYLTVQENNFDKWKNADKFDRTEYYSELIPKSEMVEIDKMAESGRNIQLKPKRREMTDDSNEVYIEFLNKEKGYQKDVKHFKSYEQAVNWARKNFDKFSPDMIKYKMAGGGGIGGGFDDLPKGVIKDSKLIFSGGKSYGYKDVFYILDGKWNELKDIGFIETEETKKAKDWTVAYKSKDGTHWGTETSPYSARYMYSPSLDLLREQNEGEWYGYGSSSDMFKNGGGIGKLPDLTQVQSDANSFRPDGSRPDDKPTLDVDNNTITFAFRNLGNWENDEEDRSDDDFDEEQWEDNDNRIWAGGQYAKYKTQFEDWAKKYDWYKYAKLDINTGEKDWAYFSITIGHGSSSNMFKNGGGVGEYVVFTADELKEYNNMLIGGHIKDDLNEDELLKYPNQNINNKLLKVSFNNDEIFAYSEAGTFYDLIYSSNKDYFIIVPKDFNYAGKSYHKKYHTKFVELIKEKINKYANGGGVGSDDSILNLFKKNKINKNSKEAYAEWENEVIEVIEYNENINRSQAQEIVDAKEFEMAHSWSNNTPAFNTAQVILGKKLVSSGRSNPFDYKGKTDKIREITKEMREMAKEINPTKREVRREVRMELP